MLELTMETFAEKIKSPMPVAVDFWAAWCMPCKILAPVLEELSDEMDGKAEFCKLNIDDFQELAVEYRVEHIPTVIIFKDGAEADRSVGMLGKEELRAMVEKYI